MIETSIFQYLPWIIGGGTAIIILYTLYQLIPAIVSFIVMYVFISMLFNVISSIMSSLR